MGRSPGSLVRSFLSGVWQVILASMAALYTVIRGPYNYGIRLNTASCHGGALRPRSKYSLRASPDGGTAQLSLPSILKRLLR